jgi:hypothetical protein
MSGLELAIDDKKAGRAISVANLIPIPPLLTGKVA